MSVLFHKLEQPVFPEIDDKFNWSPWSLGVNDIVKGYRTTFEVCNVGKGTLLSCRLMVRPNSNSQKFHHVEMKGKVLIYGNPDQLKRLGPGESQIVCLEFGPYSNWYLEMTARAVVKVAEPVDIPALVLAGASEAEVSESKEDIADYYAKVAPKPEAIPPATLVNVTGVIGH